MEPMVIANPPDHLPRKISRRDYRARILIFTTCNNISTVPMNLIILLAMQDLRQRVLLTTTDLYRSSKKMMIDETREIEVIRSLVRHLRILKITYSHYLRLGIHLSLVRSLELEMVQLMIIITNLKDSWKVTQR